MRKVIVGMSGGVDSSITAHLLKEQGFEVEGVSFILYEARLRNTFSGCCSIESINDAARTAGQLGIRHSAVDLREEFMERVIEPFIDAYGKGVTPNPCILCNQHIKFPYLLKIAEERGADLVATGHYARVENSNKLRVTSNELKQEKEDSSNSLLVTRYSSLSSDLSLLLKGVDVKKDQSYVLYVLGREALKRLTFPLGGMRKDEVREIARTLRLSAANRPESQEICFVGEKNYSVFMENLAGETGGPLIDYETGRVLSEHKGIHFYTIGQRKRLGIATGAPLYVVRIDPASRAVYVGPKAAAMVREFLVKRVNWLMEKTGDFKASVKVRSTMKGEPAAIGIIGEDSVRVAYDEPQWAPAPGQSAVFYEGDAVVGGGVISTILA